LEQRNREQGGAKLNRVTGFIKEHNLPLKIANFIVVLLSWTWVIQTNQLSPELKLDFEPILTFIGAFISLGYLEMGGKIDDKLEVDRKMAKLLMNELPSDGDTMYFLSAGGMGDSFEAKHLSILSRFVDKWSVPEKEFHDPELEQEKAELLNLIRSFVRVASLNTWDAGNNRQRVPPEWMHEQQKRWKQVVGELDSLSSEITKQHKELFRSVRHVLKL